MKRSRWCLIDLFLLAVVVLILKVTASILWQYRHYFPPDFHSDFLQGREAYFYGSYRWYFLVHLLSAPVALLTGLVLISNRFRSWAPRLHRRLGRVQVINVLCFVAPSGFLMAFYAAAGTVSGIGFIVLSLLTALTIALGWRAAVQRRFTEHRRWMWRNFVLLCSAVILRLAVGMTVVIGFDTDWFDTAISWAGWLVPLLILECVFRWPRAWTTAMLPHA